MGRHKIDPAIKKANRQAWVDRNRSHLLQLNQEWRARNKHRDGLFRQIRAIEAKNEGLRAYGGKCICCGESRKEFLTIDHINGRNAACYHSIEPTSYRISGTRLWQQLKRKGFPDGYALLCFNCNCAKGACGYCPHERERERLTNV